MVPVFISHSIRWCNCAQLWRWGPAVPTLTRKPAVMFHGPVVGAHGRNTGLAAQAGHPWTFGILIRCGRVGLTPKAVPSGWAHRRCQLRFVSRGRRRRRGQRRRRRGVPPPELRLPSRTEWEHSRGLAFHKQATLAWPPRTALAQQICGANLLSKRNSGQSAVICLDLLYKVQSAEQICGANLRSK